MLPAWVGEEIPPAFLSSYPTIPPLLPVPPLPSPFLSPLALFLSLPPSLLSSIPPSFPPSLHPSLPPSFSSSLPSETPYCCLNTSLLPSFLRAARDVHHLLWYADSLCQWQL